ncbi:MAG: RNA polymerase factor sigma-54, partial [Pseudomonadota bacterium]
MRLGGQGGGGFADGEHNLENYVSEQQTLRHHLHHQLAICTCDQVTRAIIDHLIECIDEAGYLRTSCEQVALQMGTDLDRVTAALGVLQSMDPAGVGARSLSECLRLQLSDQGRLTEKLGLVLDNLHLMAKHDLVGLRRISGTDKKQLYSILNTIRTLDPKPGHKFGTTPVQPVSPDVFVRPRNDGSWLVELNTDTLPRVLVNNSYYTTVVAGVRTAEDKTYLSECMQTANWLVKSLDQRAHTILKVAREIVRQQDGFLTKGVEHLRPLNLKTVADAISMHESTVSRVTSNKYIETPRGLFEFKYFFTSAISSAVDGDDHSS